MRIGWNVLCCRNRHTANSQMDIFSLKVNKKTRVVYVFMHVQIESTYHTRQCVWVEDVGDKDCRGVYLLLNIIEGALPAHEEVCGVSLVTRSWLCIFDAFSSQRVSVAPSSSIMFQRRQTFKDVLPFAAFSDIHILIVLDKEDEVRWISSHDLYLLDHMFSH